MIDSVDRNLCCGCEACVQICPQSCISLKEDNEGFLFPSVDKDRCIGCGACRRVCQVLRQSSDVRRPIAGYAYRTCDEELLRRTSSGGFFSAIAKMVLSRNGVVFGASVGSDNNICHVYVESYAELDALRRSKYVQSRIGSSFVRCRDFLQKKRFVLFCGTPCQVRALKLFLGKEYDNLVTIDFACHGVPSPGVFQRYLSELATNKGGDKNDIAEINFRSKELGSAYSFSFSFKGEHFVESPQQNPFLRGFLSDIYHRRSCYKCVAKGFSSGSDYTMCDFWTVNKFMPDFVVGVTPGVSQVFVFRDRLGFFNKVKTSDSLAKFDVNDRRLIQCWVYKSVPLTSRRSVFFKNLARGMSVECAVELATHRNILAKSIGRIRAFAGKVKKVLVNK